MTAAVMVVVTAVEVAVVGKQLMVGEVVDGRWWADTMGGSRSAGSSGNNGAHRQFWFSKASEIRFSTSTISRH